MAALRADWTACTIREEREAMRFRLLGALDVETAEAPVDLGPHKQRCVLAILLLHANEIVPVDRIVDLVWGDHPPRTAEHSVQIYVSELRKALPAIAGRDLIETRPPGYVLNVPADSIDIHRFESLVREGLSAVRSGDTEPGATCLRTALESWSGDPLADFAYDEFAQGHIRSLWELRSDALEALAGVQLERGELESTRHLAQQAIAADPLREEPHRLTMLALYRSGRQAEALHHFTEFRNLLAEDLGIEPSEALRDLEERILLQDPSLGLDRTGSSKGNPYRGLRPFTEDDVDLFFGRESLVSDVLERLSSGPGLVSIVGPSGSGKSSTALAGVVPVLRGRGGATVEVMAPGARPLWELAGAVGRAGFGQRISLLHRFETDPRSLVGLVRRPLVLVVDQFEELFTLADAATAVRFAELVSHALRAPDCPLEVIVTLRADYYDRPLSVAALADLFADSVVNVKPLTPQELEQAVVEPARAVGVKVEPALLAQLVADMTEEPGALPLLQMTLFELFELTPTELTLVGYEKLGGLHGALADGAEHLLSELDTDGRELVEQLMMRLVQKSQTGVTARPAALRELLALGVDNVLLQSVLDAFTTQRLLTFDLDSSGTAVVEMAHEYLISEWPRMTEWIEAHDEDLDRIRALDLAALEWIGAARSPDYLLRGERLQGFGAWSEQTALLLTKTEAELIDASRLLQVEEERQQLERVAKEESLARSARRRLWAFGAVVAVLVAVVTSLIVVLVPEPPPDVVVWHEGRGDGSFGDLIASGVDLAVENLDVDVQEFTVEVSQWEQVGEPLAEGTRLAFISSVYLGDEVSRMLISEYPETTFVFVDCVFGPGLAEYVASFPPNLVCIAHHNEQVGFVAGVAAALTTETDHVGAIGGTNVPVVDQLLAGFRAGVRFVDPGVQVDDVYLAHDFFSGFYSPELASIAATILYEDGADVVFHAAGGSGHGLFETAASWPGPKVWAIGVDVDQWAELEVLGLPDDELALVRDHILTSARKRIDVGIYEMIRRYVSENTVEDIELGIWNGGADYATSGGHIDHILPELDHAMDAVTTGSVEIEVDYDRPIPYVGDLLLDGYG
ncbi:MAG: BTAD domain-containing putative transcriptional regulator [Acidimicrobiia bacterium]